ncbi:Oidioi.mRNA.OKI2018_I69.chr1.g714.t1.cds [Oikopleura dioica]|uniref:Oidioi.mRNA.OKI2018_I69.chr1.g714.t1.cds n=1 Tax=Oikopleura dioica TaxID=34765 RepID=A0ABN7SMF0_OIKDI|nr:Oidioi.mRNA.OKI2018_I69.chr1.g714.t1.cds [Oikopleura dioica]
MQNNNRQKRMSEFNSNLNLMVFLMVVAVVVCWLPFHVLNLSWAYGLRVRTGLCEFLQSAARFLTWFHPLVNCLLYSFMGKKFRKELRHTIYRVRTMRKRGIENDSQFLSLKSSFNSRRPSASRLVL